MGGKGKGVGREGKGRKGGRGRRKEGERSMPQYATPYSNSLCVVAPTIIICHIVKVKWCMALKNIWLCTQLLREEIVSMPTNVTRCIATCMYHCPHLQMYNLFA